MLTKSGQFDISSLVKDGLLHASPRAHGGLHYLRSIKENTIDFSTNVNPLGASQKVIAAVRKNINLISGYPDPDAKELKNAIAEYVELDRENVVVGNGSNELIHLFADAFVGKGDKVVIPMPTFFEYEFACDKNSANISYVELKEFLLDSKQMIDAIDKETKVLFICNPNNPSGMLAERGDVERILDHAYNNGTLVMLDECFIEFVDYPEKTSFTKFVREYENLVVLRTFTKAFGLAGLRVGYCLASKRVSNILNKAKVPWNVNALAQKAAVAALNDRTYLEKTRNLVKKEKKYLHNSIAKIKQFKPYRSDTNFFLIKLSAMDSVTLKEKLLKRNILVRDCSTFTGMGTDFVRIAVQRHMENRLLVNALKAI
ncbi:MAG: histidinol-phosphate transaminase [Nitrososphaerales archaeon]